MVLVFYCCLNDVTFSLCYIIIFQILINNRLSNKYHRRWCALAVCFHWVGHSGMTIVQFGPLACSALWLLAHRMNGSVLRLTDTINLGVTKYQLSLVDRASNLSGRYPRLNPHWSNILLLEFFIFTK